MNEFLEHYANSSKQPIICPHRFMPNSENPVLLGEYDTAYIYLWCRICRDAHPIRFKDIGQSAVQLTSHAEISVL